MSTVSGLASKGEKGKQKYSALNINNLYKGKSLENPKTSIAPKHGLQTLGKVGAGRRIPPPANLPSLKSQTAGSNSNINLVPSGGQGWGSGKEEDSGVTSPLQTSSGQPEIQSQKFSQPNQPTSEPIAIANAAAISVPSTQNIQNNSSQSQITKTWSNVTATPEEGGQDKNFLAHSAAFFPQEFPKLAGGNAQQELIMKQNADPSYGPGPSLRPQTEGNWGRGTLPKTATGLPGNQSPNSGSGVNGQQIQTMSPPLPDGSGPVQMTTRGNYPQIGVSNQSPRTSMPANVPMENINTGSGPNIINQQAQLSAIPSQFKMMPPPYVYGRGYFQGPIPVYPMTQNFSHPSQQGSLQQIQRAQYYQDARLRRMDEEVGQRQGAPAPPPVISDQDLKGFDEILQSEMHDDWIGGNNEIDYNAKLVFSDDEEVAPSESSDRSERKQKIAGDERWNYEKDERRKYRSEWQQPQQSHERNQRGSYQDHQERSYQDYQRSQQTHYPSRHQPTHPSHPSHPPSHARNRSDDRNNLPHQIPDDDELWRQRSRQSSDEMQAAVVRARLRREEEEKKMEKTRQAAHEKLRALEERSNLIEKDKEQDERSRHSSESRDDKQPQRPVSYPANSYSSSKQFKNVPPRFQKLQQAEMFRQQQQTRQNQQQQSLQSQNLQQQSQHQQNVQQQIQQKNQQHLQQLNQPQQPQQLTQQLQHQKQQQQNQQLHIQQQLQQQQQIQQQQIQQQQIQQQQIQQQQIQQQPQQEKQLQQLQQPQQNQIQQQQNVQQNQSVQQPNQSQQQQQQQQQQHQIVQQDQSDRSAHSYDRQSSTPRSYHENEHRVSQGSIQSSSSQTVNKTSSMSDSPKSKTFSVEGKSDVKDVKEKEREKREISKGDRNLRRGNSSRYDSYHGRGHGYIGSSHGLSMSSFRGGKGREYRRSRDINDKSSYQKESSKGKIPDYPRQKSKSEKKSESYERESYKRERRTSETKSSKIDHSQDSNKVKETLEKSKSITPEQTNHLPSNHLPSTRNEPSKRNRATVFRSGPIAVNRSYGPSNYGPPPLKAAFTEGTNKANSVTSAKSDDHHSNRDNYHSNRDSYHSNRDNYHSNRDNNHSNRDNLHSNRDNLHSNRDNLHSNRDNLHSNRDNIHSNRDNQGSKDDNYSKSKQSNLKTDRNSNTANGSHYKSHEDANKNSSSHSRRNEYPSSRSDPRNEQLVARFQRKPNLSNRSGRGKNWNEKSTRSYGPNETDAANNDEWETASESSDVNERKSDRRRDLRNDNKNYSRKSHNKRSDYPSSRSQHYGSNYSSSTYRDTRNRNSGGSFSSRTSRVSNNQRNGQTSSSNINNNNENVTICSLNDVTLDNPSAVDVAICDAKKRSKSSNEFDDEFVDCDGDDRFQTVSYKKRNKTIEEKNSKKIKQEVSPKQEIRKNLRHSKLPPRLAKQRENMRLNKAAGDPFPTVTNLASSVKAMTLENVINDKESLTSSLPNAWSRPLSHSLQAPTTSSAITTVAKSTTVNEVQALSVSSKSSSFDQHDSGVDVNDQLPSTASSQRSSPSNDDNKPNTTTAKPTSTSTTTTSTTSINNKEQTSNESEIEMGKPMGTVIFENAKFKKENAALTKSAADRLNNKEISIRSDNLSSMEKKSVPSPIGNGKKNESAINNVKMEFAFSEKERTNINKTIGRNTGNNDSLNIQSVTSPSADELNMKIASVKKVWDAPSMQTVESSNDDSPKVDSSSQLDESKNKNRGNNTSSPLSNVTSSNSQSAYIRSYKPEFPIESMMNAAMNKSKQHQQQLQQQNVQQQQSVQQQHNLAYSNQSQIALSQTLQHQQNQAALIQSQQLSQQLLINQMGTRQLENLRSLSVPPGIQMGAMPSISSQPTIMYNNPQQVAAQLYQAFTPIDAIQNQMRVVGYGTQNAPNPYNQQHLIQQSNPIGHTNMFMANHNQNQAAEQYRVNSVAAAHHAAAHQQATLANTLLKSQFNYPQVQNPAAMHPNTAAMHHNLPTSWTGTQPGQVNTQSGNYYQQTAPSMGSNLHQQQYNVFRKKY